MTGNQPSAFGGPLIEGTLREVPADFQVDEVLGFEPSGSGEHAFLQVEKTGANTEWVARQLAAAAGVSALAVGYAGMKDRHAVTRQTFTVQLPGRADPDWSALTIPGVRVIDATRHNRKLKRGAHRGNRFVIRLRNVHGACEEVDARVHTMRERGVPNYFGEQRFGRDGGNVALAQGLFAGRRLSRPQRSIALSAARSFLFNEVLSSRVRAGSWDRPLDGDVWMLDGTRAIFGPEPWTDDLAHRLSTLDIHPTGPMWGRGDLRTQAVARILEQTVVEDHADLSRGLEQAGLEQERRSLRLSISDLSHAWEAPDILRLDFALASGAFATTVLRELCDWHSPPVTHDHPTESGAKSRVDDAEPE